MTGRSSTLRQFIREALQHNLILEASNADSFLSLVIGTDLSRGGSENEALQRKKLVVKSIRKPDHDWATISSLAKIMVENQLYDLSTRDALEWIRKVEYSWTGFLSTDEITSLVKELENLLSSRIGGKSRSQSAPPPPPVDPSTTSGSGERGPSARVPDGFEETLYKVIEAQTNFEKNIISLATKDLTIQRSSGKIHKARFFYYKPHDNTITVKWSEGGQRLTKSYPIYDLISLNSDVEELVYIYMLTNVRPIFLTVDKNNGFLGLLKDVAGVTSTSSANIIARVEAFVIDPENLYVVPRLGDMYIDRSGTAAPRRNKTFYARAPSSEPRSITSLIDMNPWLMSL